MANFALFGWVEQRGGRYAAVAAAMPTDPTRRFARTEIHERLLDSEHGAMNALVFVGAALAHAVRRAGGNVLGYRVHNDPPAELRGFLVSRREAGARLN